MTPQQRVVRYAAALTEWRQANAICALSSFNATKDAAHLAYTLNLRAWLRAEAESLFQEGVYVYGL